MFDTLTKKEIRFLSRFIRSPFFNQQEDLVRFLDLLVEYRQDLKLIPSKEKVHARLFSGQAYEDTKIRLLMSKLHKLIEHFLAYQEFFSDEVNPRILLSGAYRKRGLTQHFQRTVRETQQIQEKKAFRHAEFYDEQYRLQLEEYKWLANSRRTEELRLQEISTTVDISYLSLKLRQTCFLLAHQRVYKIEYDFGMLPEVITYIERKNLLHIPAIAIYYYCYQSLVRPEEEYSFQQFKLLILENTRKFPPDEIKDLLILAINYCIKKLNDGQLSYAREGLDLYKKGLEEEFIIENGQLSRFTYNNVVGMGLWVKEFNWVEQFINEYQNSLDKSYQESTYHFNLARLEYTRQNYHDALLHLQRAEYKDLLNNLIAKTLQIKIYYELGEFDLLESHLDTLKTFIRRKKVMGYHRKNYLNIVHFTKKLLTTNTYNNKMRKELYQAIEMEEILTEKNWLLAQLKMQ